MSRLPKHVLLHVWLIVALLAPLSAETQRLDERVVPISQAIELDIDASLPRYSGSVRIDLMVKETADSFTFHAEGQEFEQLTLRSGQNTIAATWERGKDAIVTVQPDHPLSPGPHTLEIDFTNEFNTQAVGLYRVEHQGLGYLFTQFESVDARKAFPCWDEPIYKIPFQMTLAVPAEHAVVANTPIESEEDSDGWRRVTFAKTKPMPTYLLAIASGPLESMEIEGLSVPGRIYSVNGQIGLASQAAAITPSILSALEDQYGIQYPYAKLDFIAIPEYWFGAMENVGAVTFLDRLLLQDPETASVSQRRGQAAVIAHELAHMWFGDLVTMSWWNDLWLNESFASLVGDKITEQLFPEYQLDLTNRRGIQGLMTQDARLSTKPIRREIETLATIFEDLGLAYGKGQTVLTMIEQWIGEEAFRRGVTQYLEDHAWGNAVADDLWSALSESSGRDLRPVLASFLDQPGLPLITASIDDAGDLVLDQRRFLNQGVEAPSQLWTLPVRVRLSIDGELSSETVLLAGESLKIPLGGGTLDWAYPDDGAFSYLRWQVPAKMFLELAASSAELLTAPERVAFVGNATGLLDAGVISGGDFLGVLRALADDSEPEVVSSVITGINRVSAQLVPEAGRELFAAYLRDSLRPAIDRFGLELRAGEAEAVSLFRPRLFALLGDTGQDAEVRQRAATLASSYLDDPTAVDPSLAGSILKVAAIEGNRALFETFKRRFEAAATPVERSHFLGALGYFSDPEIQLVALGYNLSGTLRPTELFTIPGSIARTEEGGNRAFNWLVESWDELAPRLPQMVVSFMPFFAGGCSEERLEIATEFFTNPAHQVDGTLNNLTKVSEQVTDCARLRRREGPSVLRFLKEEPEVAQPEEKRG